MAVVLTSLTATLTRTVFVKPPDMIRQYTPIPRAIVNFNILDGTLDAKPVNDQQELIIGMSLDASFAYKWLTLNFSLVQDVANDWLNRGYLELTNAIRNLEVGMTQRHVLSFDDLFRVPQGGEMLGCRSPGPYAVGDLPTYVIQRVASSTGAPIITLKATNQTAAVGAAGTVNFYASFMEYDIEQAESFVLHNPVNVHRT